MSDEFEFTTPEEQPAAFPTSAQCLDAALLWKMEVMRLLEKQKE